MEATPHQHKNQIRSMPIYTYEDITCDMSDITWDVTYVPYTHPKHALTHAHECGAVVQCVTVCCGALQGVAGCCRVLQCVFS
jgi:predicted nucleic acid-binding Zn ribbon protein